MLPHFVFELIIIMQEDEASSHGHFECVMPFLRVSMLLESVKLKNNILLYVKEQFENWSHAQVNEQTKFFPYLSQYG